jgi:hypothetical protein
VTSIFDAVEEMVRGLARSLPDSAAELQVDRNAETTSRRTIFMLIPSKPSAAQVHLDIEEHSDVVAVSVGRGAVFEVPREGHRYTDLDCVHEIRALCLAAIRGELRETVWFKGEEVVAADAKVRIGSA